MKGKVVSYIKNKKYGFINGDDGESYFIHCSSLNNHMDEAKLLKGVLVEFDPTPAPKGLAAKHVTVPDVYFKTQLVDFFISKSNTPKHGNIEQLHSISTRFFKDPKEGRSHIKQLANEAGCNAILNLDFEKNTFSSGNYRYTVHAFKGDLALVSERIPSNDLQDESSSQDAIAQKVMAFNRKFQLIQDREAGLRAKQLKKNYIGLYIVLGIVVFMLMAALSR
ncbi:cold shock domain-containing protein [Shewanella gelidimarina]|uniref:cold-shock protein n=1 Tax=Shewanella gelidimarina TaxID=56813 RepID=UPI00200F2F72|nr:cold shock domain-containing protein [Shewanella gelidimarina]MCL1058599.1 cold shock domain-containing protein [Shewanella gelidimarina]